MASIFLPLTLLATIYGVSFEHMPGLSWRWSYLGAVGFIGTVALSAAWWSCARRRVTLGRWRRSKAVPSAVERGKRPSRAGHVARRHN
jgi:hypothetical protein